MMDRLEAVFEIVPSADSIADIGTDHGYLAVELIVRGKAKRVIAGDVHKGPLESAKSYVTSRGLSNVIDCRLGDGLQVTKKGELNGAICCGMGGFSTIYGGKRIPYCQRNYHEGYGKNIHCICSSSF